MSTRPVDVVFARAYEAPWGVGWVYVRRGRLVGVDLPGDGPTGPVVTVSPSADDAEALERWAGELTAYFAGRRSTWTPEEVDLDGLGLGTFERAVYATLLTVPPAATVSYGALAKMAGYPRAARAVGNAMAANPIPVVVPCHRVIRSDGSLGSYGDDPAWKARLLAHEAAGLEAVRTGEGQGEGG